MYCVLKLTPTKHGFQIIVVLKVKKNVLILPVFGSLLQTVSVPEFDGRGLSAVRKFESNLLAANTPNEDRRSAATCLQVCIF